MHKYQDMGMAKKTPKKATKQSATVLEKHPLKSGFFTKKPGMKGDC